MARRGAVGRSSGQNPPVRVSAKADYGIRALIELAALEEEGGAPVKRDQIGAAQEIPVAFLENILLELKRAGLVRSVRGQAGGFRLARPPGGITLAEIIRALDGPLASVRGARPEELDYAGRARPCATSGSPSREPEGRPEDVTLADLLGGELPAEVR